MAYTSSPNNIPCGRQQVQQPGGFQTQMPGGFQGQQFQSAPSGFQGGAQLPQPLPTMPTGFPTGGTATPLLHTPGGLPSTVSEQMPTTVQSTLFTPGFLRTQIGKMMRVEFLLGSGPLVDRTGTLLSVGASYILLKMVESNDIMMCDIYSIKFVTILL